MELKLGTLVFRAGFSKTIKQAKQLISHGYFYINNKKISNFNYLCVKNDIISTTKKESLNLFLSKTESLPDYFSFISEKNCVRLESTNINPIHTIDILKSVEYYL